MVRGVMTEVVLYSEQLHGHARVYQYANSTWTKVEALLHGEVNGDEFGHSIALNNDGTIIAISSIKHSSDTGFIKKSMNITEVIGLN